MDQPPIMTNKRWAWILAGVVALATVLLWVQSYRAGQQRREQRIEAEGITTVLSATFAKANKLKVGEVTGAMDVTSVDPGAVEILRSSQSVTLPYSVDYTVDLAGLDPDKFKWDAASRTLMVEVPGVVAEAPNIDETKRKLKETSGLFVTRGAADNLSRRASSLAAGAATREAAKPEQRAKAEANAREAIAQMIQTPLSVAGIGDVKVVVRFPSDGYRDSERWDVTPSFEQILARQPGNSGE